MDGMMKAAVFEDIGKLTLKKVPIPKIEKDDQLLVKVEAVSICGTDVHIMANPPRFIATPNTILGHEFVGSVVEKGSAISHLEIGDHVVVNPNDYCGVCQFCRRNLPNQCENLIALGIHANGAFADYCRISGRVAHKISKDVPVEIAAFAEPLACVLNGTNKIKIQPADSVAVLGGGPIGMIMAMMAKAAGASKVFLAETTPYRIEQAKKLKLGMVVDVKKEKLGDVILRETGIGVDVAADMVGSQMETAVNVVRKNGKVLLFGMNMQAIAQIIQSQVTTKELQILGTWLANATFPEAVKVLESEVLDIKSLITEIIPLDEIHQGIQRLGKGEAIKIIVKP